MRSNSEDGNFNICKNQPSLLKGFIVKNSKQALWKTFKLLNLAQNQKKMMGHMMKEDELRQIKRKNILLLSNLTNISLMISDFCRLKISGHISD